MYKITTNTGLEEIVDFPRYIQYSTITNSWCIWDNHENQLKYAEAVMVKSEEEEEKFTVKDENGKEVEKTFMHPTFTNCDIDTLTLRHEGFPLAHIEKVEE